MEIIDYLTLGVEQGASDIHIIAGSPIALRITGSLKPYGDEILNNESTKRLVYSMLNENQKKTLDEVGEVDLAYSVPSLSRFRVNAFRQRGTYAAAIRVITARPPTHQELMLPDVIVELARLKNGLVLVTGPTGSGKSTTIAALINLINSEKNNNIITLEDPIEYMHNHKKSLVSQREIGGDSKSYSSALRAALREDPDVILVGEMRDLETISIALTAAETGHLVFSSLHTIGAAKTIDRVTDVFEPHQQQQVRMQLATVLRGVVSQQLLPLKHEKGRTAAFEIMLSTPAISNNIRDSKTFLVKNAIQTGRLIGMVDMDTSLAELVRNDKVDFEVAKSYAVDREQFSKIVYGR